MVSHYTYRLIAQNPIDDRVEYIGVRSCKCSIDDDAAYMSSSLVVKALKKQGMVFTKEVIAVWPTRNEAIAHEIELHKTHDVQRNGRFFNEARQRSVGFAKAAEIKWSRAACMVDAKKYSKKVDWKTANQSAYNAARHSEWLADCCAHMDIIKLPNGHWTREACLAEASKYKTRREWRDNSGSSLLVAQQNGWNDECCAHMKRILQPSGYWTIDKCKEIAKAYKNKGRWQRGHVASYKAAVRSGFIDECCGHMCLYVPRGTWTKENCIRDACNYSSRSEWKLKSGSAYRISSRNGWLDDCCSHMCTKKDAA